MIEKNLNNGEVAEQTEVCSCDKAEGCNCNCNEQVVATDAEAKVGFWQKLGNTKFVVGFKNWWANFKAKHPTLAQFIMFFILCNGVTVLQLIMMPLFKAWFGSTALLEVNFQVFRIGNNFDGSPYFMFDYAAGAIDATGKGGGLAYFLAIQVTMAIAQVINFFAQRNITFKANNNPWWAAMWYAIAYIAITFIAAAAQGFYKAPIYELFINTWGWGATGETLADMATMIINCAIAFWVFFPIFKLIFKEDKYKDAK